MSKQASRAGECWSAPILCEGISLLCPLHPCCCALLHGSKDSPPAHPPFPPVKGLPSVWKPFLLHSSLPEVQVPSLLFCLCFFFFLLPYPGNGEFLAFWEVWGLLPAFSRCSVVVVAHVDVFLMYLWGGRWSPCLTLLPSWRSPSNTFNMRKSTETSLKELPMFKYLGSERMEVVVSIQFFVFFLVLTELSLKCDALLLAAKCWKDVIKRNLSSYLPPHCTIYQIHYIVWGQMPPFNDHILYASHTSHKYGRSRH